MKVYKVFTGIELIINEFESTTCLCNVPTYDNIIEINHCEEGRQECELSNGSYLYLGEGDLSINTMNNRAHTMGFSLKYYKGISVLLYLDEVARDVPEILQDICIDIMDLKKSFALIMNALSCGQMIKLKIFFLNSTMYRNLFKKHILS